MSYNKYKVADKVDRTWNGKTYASRREAEIAKVLHAGKSTGAIKTLIEQPRYELIPKPNKIDYIPDFYVEYPTGEKEVIDVKGFQTDVFRIKAKLFRHFYPTIPLRLLK